MSEKLIRIPVRRYLADKQERRITREIEYITTLGPDVQVVSDEEAPNLISGLIGPTARIILNYFELTEKLLSESYIEFPPADPNFNEKVVDRARYFGMSAVQIPGYSSVPKITDLLRKKEIDGRIYHLLWEYVAPDVPVPLQVDIDEVALGMFLGSVLRQSHRMFGEDKYFQLLEEDGTTPYSLTFHQPANMLVEDFPDVVGSPVNDKLKRIVILPPSLESPLLDILGIPRTSVFYDNVMSAIELHGNTVLENLYLDPKQYRLHFLRYEDFLRLGPRHNWGIGPYYTYLQGFLYTDVSTSAFYAHPDLMVKQIPVAGYKTMSGSEFDRHTGKGLHSFNSVYRNQTLDHSQGYRSAPNVRDVIVRFAISRRKEVDSGLI